jgi:hypothetical protein
LIVRFQDGELALRRNGGAVFFAAPPFFVKGKTATLQLQRWMVYQSKVLMTRMYNIYKFMH